MNSYNYSLPLASKIAEDVDAAFMFITIVGFIFFLGTTFVSVYFTWKYYRRDNKAKFTSSIDGNKTLEVVWTVIPTLLLIAIFFWGFRSYMDGRIVPPDAIEIKVTGKKWFWSFDYPNGMNSVNELIVPEGRPVKALISSTDVIHSFYVPAFRAKMDAVPNRYTIMSFVPIEKGTFDIFCAEYCGTTHSGMVGKIKVVSNAEYTKWLENASSGGDMKPEEVGAKIFKEKACFTCHTIDGTVSIGPSWKGIFGNQRVFADGGNATADENYLRSSMLTPNTHIVNGFQGVMPSYQGILNDKQIDAIIAYIKTLK